MNQTQLEWIQDAALAAQSADHVWPEMAACEAALESNYGQSGLAKDGNNLFGMKQHVHAVYGSLSLPTREYLGGEWEVVDAVFVKYPTLADCFTDRQDTLERLRGKYSNYDNALKASSPLAYVSWVSKTWSTDPLRAEKCISIYAQFQTMSKTNNAESVNDAATGEK